MASWQRSEALGSLDSVRLLQLPRPEFEDDAHAANEFELLRNIVVRRVGMLTSIANSVLDPLSRRAPRRSNQRDEFGINKLALTFSRSASMLLGIYTGTGDVAWELFVPGWSIIDTYVIKSVVFGEPEALVLARTSEQSFVLLTINPITGKRLSPARELTHSVQSAVLLPYRDADHRRPLLIIDEQHGVHVYPAEAATLAAFSNHLKSSMYYSVDRAAGIATGYRYVSNTNAAAAATAPWHLDDAWRFVLPLDHELAAVAYPNAREHVFSPVRVTGNSTVLPKYLQPNVLAIATVQSPDNKGASFLSSDSVNIYVLNTATGAVLHHTLIPGASGPVRLVTKENWLIVSYWNARSYRNELAVLDMFEPQLKWNEYVSTHRTLSLSLSLSQYVLTPTIVSLVIGRQSHHLIVSSQSFFNKPIHSHQAFVS